MMAPPALAERVVPGSRTVPMTRSAITHMRQTGPRDIAARLGVVCPVAWGVGDVRDVGIRRYRRDASGRPVFGQPDFGWVAVGIADRVARPDSIAFRDAQRVAKRDAKRVAMRTTMRRRREH